MVIFPIPSGKLTGCYWKWPVYSWFTSGYILKGWSSIPGLGGRKRSKASSSCGPKRESYRFIDHMKVLEFHHLKSASVLSVLYICIDSTLHYIILSTVNYLYMYTHVWNHQLYVVVISRSLKNSFPSSGTEASDRLVYTPHLWIYSPQIQSLALEMV